MKRQAMLCNGRSVKAVRKNQVSRCPIDLSVIPLVKTPDVWNNDVKSLANELINASCEEPGSCFLCGLIGCECLLEGVPLDKRKKPDTGQSELHQDATSRDCST
ncbi:hypothetical protein RRG08_008744 [Elysia crispata]|uniref:Uncharacterized protein n=1 Tax=Elysia crispata TaxID=231223 RepID=A0AAE0YUP0_9GAST|nr:hypothetical protein RRG08_008744 [Elysia crispata]